MLSAKFRAKQTKFELLYARKCQKSLKTHKIAIKHVISFIGLLFSIITISIPNSKFRAKYTKFELIYARKCLKSIKEPLSATYEVILRI